MRSIAAIAMLALVLVLAGGGSLLSQIDQLRAEDRVQAAQLRLEHARAELALVLARQAIASRDVKPDNLCERRTDALRDAILALVRTGRASMVGDPGWEWASWR